MLCIRIIINPINDNNVEFRIERFEDGKYRFFDSYETDSQSASSRLIWEKEKAENGVFNLILEDNRKKFVLV